MKKGATHADWAISLGLFLIYILSMFMILQPGIQPIFREEQLLDILEGEISTDARFIVSKTPLKINTIASNFSGPGEYYVLVEYGLPLSKDGKKAAIFNEGGYIDENLIELDKDKLQFHAWIDEGQNNFWVYEILYPDKIGEEYEYDNSLPVPGAIISNTKNNFSLMFGSPEIVKGVDWNMLISDVIDNEGLSCSDEEDYLELKTNFSFPPNKEFIIQAVEKAEPRYSLEELMDICNIEVPYEQTSVFSREWLSYKVNKEAGREPIRMKVTVW